MLQVRRADNRHEHRCFGKTTVDTNTPSLSKLNFVAVNVYFELVRAKFDTEFRLHPLNQLKELASRVVVVLVNVAKECGFQTIQSYSILL